MSGLNRERGPVVRVVDDDPEMRKSLAWLFDTASLEVETYASFKDFKNRDDPLTPGCLILDLRLADEDGIAVMEKLSSQPDFHLPVIILTGHGGVDAAVRCMKLGADDFFEKPMDPQKLIDRVRQLIAGHVCRCRELGRLTAARRRIELLSPRELQMADLIGQGLSSKQIAAKLGLSMKTVDNHRARAIAKTGASNSAALVQILATASGR